MYTQRKNNQSLLILREPISRIKNNELWNRDSYFLIHHSSVMCGIFGYIGPKQTAADIVFRGLKTLEYRGYDSWGIAIQLNKESRSMNQGKIIIKKELGKLPEAIHSSKFLIHNSHIAIGHTRWATHGGVTKKNAHPHYDCTKTIAVLHNGIVENYHELKEKLLKKGHTFTSETDTEVIAHLLEDQLVDTRGVTRVGIPRQAMQHTFTKLHGLNAIIAINTSSDEIVAAKNGSPLIVGIGQNEYFLSSDLAGILPYTNKVIFIKDNELVTLCTNRGVARLGDPRRAPAVKARMSDGGEERQDPILGINLISLTTGKKLTPEIETIDWKIEETIKGTYKHFMLKEIYEQPKIIETIAKSYTDQVTTLANVIKKAKGTFFIGSGTAFHACLAGTYLFADIAKKHVNTAPASEFTYLEDFLTNESLIIPLSQSGETIDVIEPITRAKKKGSTIMSLVNVIGSTLYRMSEYKLLLGAGPEKAVASTKAYTAKIAFLVLIAYTLAGKQQVGKDILLKTVRESERLLEKHTIDRIKKIATMLATKQHIYLIGRGVSYATALEGALKIKEVSYIPTDGLAGGELKHGTIALIEKGTPCLVIAPKDETYDAIISNAMEIKSRGGYLIGLSEKHSPLFDEWIDVKDTGCPLLTDIIPLQLLAYFIAVTKKLDPDKPRNLAKSVTVK